MHIIDLNNIMVLIQYIQASKTLSNLLQRNRPLDAVSSLGHHGQLLLAVGSRLASYCYDHQLQLVLGVGRRFANYCYCYCYCYYGRRVQLLMAIECHLSQQFPSYSLEKNSHVSVVSSHVHHGQVVIVAVGGRLGYH